MFNVTQIKRLDNKAVEQVAALAADWLKGHLNTPAQPPQTWVRNG